jgi:Putative phage metallopeptidase
MANIYLMADESINLLVNSVIKNWHPDLFKVNLKVGALFALAGRETQPAIKENGHEVEGIIKIVPLKDRVSKGYDVEMILDGDEWKDNQHNHKIAVIDHLLSRLEVKKPKKKKDKKKLAVHGTDDEVKQHEPDEFITDDIGRPVLKIRRGDWNAGFGFREVVERHGLFSPESRNLDKASIIVAAALRIYKEETAKID